MPLQLTADTNPGTATWTETAFTSNYAGGGDIGAGTNSVTIPVGAFWPASADGGFVIISQIDTGGGPDSSALSFAWSWDGSGNLTITANANANADTSLAVGVLS